MTPPVVALVIFIATFAVATLRKVHTGILMFAVAAGVGLFLAGMPLDDVVAGFPLNLLVLLVGVTYFFAIAQVNGTIDRLVEFTVARVGTNAFLLPILFFVLTAGIAAMGSPLAGLVMAPVGMPIARKHRVDPMLMGLAIGGGISSGAFAPTSLFGIVTVSTAESAGVDLNPLVLFAIAAGTNIVLLAVAYVLFGGRALSRRRFVPADFTREFSEESSEHRPAGAGDDGAIPVNASGSAADGVRVLAESRPVASPQRMQVVHLVTLGLMVALIGTVILLALLGLDPDIGVLAFVFASVLMLIDPPSGRAAVSKIDWSTVLLVGGIITFVSVMQEMGAVDLLGDAAAEIGAPLVSAFVLCVLAGLISAFASTTGMLAALVPIAIPLVANGGVAGWAIIAALAVCASIVDVSPFSTVGAAVVATADESDRARVTRLLARWGLSMVIIGPVLLVGLLVLPTSL
ncbi:C4-dicarboxylate ABC transporter [Microbacterium mangrovi]|uniref:C4-dicarboxylate ABC transporter n=1 Tax=Microbacterium mangrovi TaxID=1348253 RepID=A0A0B2A6A8_9MICO|nr:SLC13 family permease [Microbacterium mangrovi]KHK97093.1 C4-dicarboxylate ABC transporter [Microbacterium mangrovi]